MHAPVRGQDAGSWRGPGRSARRFRVSGHGVEWLVRDTVPGEVFTPERFSRRAPADRADGRRIRRERSHPGAARLDRRTGRWRARLIGRAGALGLVGTDTPEAYGGVGLDKAAADHRRRRDRRGRGRSPRRSARSRASHHSRSSALALTRRRRNTCRASRAVRSSAPTA